jgi:carboxyl-terminal processing protease
MTQKIIFYICIILGLSHQSASSQEIKNKEIQLLIDSTISIMKNNSVNSNNVDWAILKENATLKATNLSSPYELGDIMRYFYRSVNDFHGAFFYRDSVFRFSRKEPLISDSIKNEWKKRSGIKSKLLRDNIGYLIVPSMPGASKSRFDSLAQSLNDSLCFLLTNNVKGIIIDLRTNGGGAIYPMVLGLEPLLQLELVGSFQTKIESKWLLKGHSFYIDTAKLASIIPKCSIDAANLPVAILTSNATGSSGEFLIMAFKGRRNTRILGTTTAGYVTVNDGFKINDEAFMNLSVGYGKDRNGKIYIKHNDDKVIAATKWLKSIKK